MKLSALLLALLWCAVPAGAQTSERGERTVYGARMLGSNSDEDPTDRSVLKRLDTRVNNRLETRIERYRFIDPRSDATSVITPNPYRSQPTTTQANGASAWTKSVTPRSE